jgi:hypothetical protein
MRKADSRVAAIHIQILENPRVFPFPSAPSRLTGPPVRLTIRATTNLQKSDFYF